MKCHVYKSLWEYLAKESRNILNEYFQEGNIIEALYQFLDEKEQVALVKTLAGQLDSLHVHEEKNIISKNLSEFKIINSESTYWKINTFFQKNLNNLLIGRKENIFSLQEVKAQVGQQELEKSIHKWNTIYEYILKNVGCPNSSKLRNNISELLSSRRLVISLLFLNEEHKEKEENNSIGFEFLIENKIIQFNQFLVLYFKFILDKYSKFFKEPLKTNSGSKLPKIKLFSLICFFNNSSPYSIFSVELLQNKFYFPQKLVNEILADLESLGLIHFQGSNMFSVSQLFNNILSHKKEVERFMSTNLIIENDFRMYAYSNFTFTKYLLNLFSDVIIMFPNLTVVKLSGNKIINACKKGIKSSSILNFLSLNLHPSILQRKKSQILKNKKHNKGLIYLLPENVHQQLILWGSEYIKQKADSGFRLKQDNGDRFYQIKKKPYKEAYPVETSFKFNNTFKPSEQENEFFHEENSDNEFNMK